MIGRIFNSENQLGQFYIPSLKPMSYLPLKENNKEGKKSMHRQSFSFLKKTLFLTLIRPGKEEMDTSENLDDQSWGIE